MPTSPRMSIGRSHCQPHEATTQPRRISQPSPASIGGCGSLLGPRTGRVAWLKSGTVTRLPRLTTSRMSLPLIRERSTGRRIETSEAKATRRQGDVRNGSVRGVTRVDGEVERAGQLLVTANVAEGAAAREGPAQRHFKARDRHVPSAETYPILRSRRPDPWSPIVS